MLQSFKPLHSAFSQQIQRIQYLSRSARASTSFWKLTFNIIFFHPIPQRFPRHSIFIRRCVHTVTFLNRYQSISQMLRRILLVRFLLKDICLYVDDCVRSSSHDARPGVDVEWYTVVHVDEMPCHDFGGGPHACNKTGKRPVSKDWGGRALFLAYYKVGRGKQGKDAGVATFLFSMGIVFNGF